MKDMSDVKRIVVFSNKKSGLIIKLRSHQARSLYKKLGLASPPLTTYSSLDTLAKGSFGEQTLFIGDGNDAGEESLSAIVEALITANSSSFFILLSANTSRVANMQHAVTAVSEDTSHSLASGVAGIVCSLSNKLRETLQTLSVPKVPPPVLEHMSPAQLAFRAQSPQPPASPHPPAEQQDENSPREQDRQGSPGSQHPSLFYPVGERKEFNPKLAEPHL